MAILKKQFKENKEAKKFLKKHGKYNIDGELVLEEGIRTTILETDSIRETHLCSDAYYITKLGKLDGNISFWSQRIDKKENNTLVYNTTKSDLIVKT